MDTSVTLLANRQRHDPVIIKEVMHHTAAATKAGPFAQLRLQPVHGSLDAKLHRDVGQGLPRLRAEVERSLAPTPLGDSEVQHHALVIADNKLAENAGWDEELLASELAALRSNGFELDVVGFSEEELADLLGGLDDDLGGAPAPGDPDHVPETAIRPVSSRGDMWCLGDHRVMCGDSTSKEEVAFLCDGRLVDACWTDPPYNVAYEGTAGKIHNDDMSTQDFRNFLFSAFTAAHAVLRTGGPIYIAHADTEGFNPRPLRVGQGSSAQDRPRFRS